MAKQQRRGGSSHPGVVVCSRTLKSGTVQWRARYTDPDRDKKVEEVLDPVELHNATLRRDWAVRKSKALAKRRVELDMGIPIKKQSPLGDAVDQFYEDARNRLNGATVDTYEYGIRIFQEWSASHGVHFAEDITPDKLVLFRKVLVAQDKQVPTGGQTRGTHAPQGKKRSAITNNSYLTHVKILLNDLRSLGLTPNLSRDTIEDSLKPLRESLDPPEFLTPTQLRALLTAAMRHDAATFAMTRQERASEQAIGATPRYEPIAPLIATLLLTGIRPGELLKITWSMIDLSATNHDGQVVGEARLPANITKTRRGRTVGFEVSPGLHKLLQALQPRTAHYFGDQPLFVTRAGDPYTKNLLKSSLKRLLAQGTRKHDTYGAPAFSWKLLRSTCDTYLVNAPGIFGSSATFLASKQLGHSVAIAEKHYQGVFRGIPREARTLEAAMQIEGVLDEVIKTAHLRPQP